MKPIHSVRLRFAPSPTGFLHVGGARTALFNYLYARHNKGKFLLRIEDTDLSRSNKEMIDVIFRSLKWLGLLWDEEPLYQSERTERYRSACHELIQRKAAYRCFCSSEELAQKREIAQKEYRYDRTCFKLSEAEIEKKRALGIPFAVRFYVPPGETTFRDAVRGTVTVQNQEMDDFIILRSDNSPMYQIAVVVDDHDMQITHIIRGDDHLSNTPKQILIYRAMDWDLPQFAHVPMILGLDKKRLSKRHGATSVEEYRKGGFLPQAVVNFLALLGWSPGDNREILSMDEMVETFSLERISRNPAVLDESKLVWMNAQYLAQTDDDRLLESVSVLLKENGLIDDHFVTKNRDYLLRYIRLMKSKMKRISDFAVLGGYFFEDPSSYEEKSVKKYWNEVCVASHFDLLVQRLEPLDSWNAVKLEEAVRGLAEEKGISAGKLIHPVRLALTGYGVSPGLFELMEVLGKENVVRRLQKAIHYLKRNRGGKKC